MKTEQEIVLRKKTIIAVSLLILVLAMGILNIQKNTVLAAAGQGQITKVYKNYITNEAFFKIELSGDFSSGDLEKMKNGTYQAAVVPNETENVVEVSNASGEVSGEVSGEGTTPSGEIVEPVSEEKTDVAARGSYVRDLNVPPTEYEKVIEVKATAYCLCQKCCGKAPTHPGYGYTASGLRIIPGTGMKVIAVDPNYVKLGSEVYVEGLNGAPSYGYAIAADTGGAIKNNKIDLYMDTHQLALQWGVRNVRLYVLKSE